MNPTPVASPSPGPHTYKQQNGGVLYGAAVVFAVIGLATALYLGAGVPGLFTLLVCWGVAIWMAANTNTLALTLSEGGLEYRNLSGTRRISWAEVLCVLPVSSRYGVADFLRMTNGQTIPLSQFGGVDWRHGPIGQDLQAWAPHLLKPPANI